MTDLVQPMPNEVEAIRRFVVPWTELDWPIDWGDQFGRSAPLGVEVGFGNGDFLVDLAQKYPETGFIGIERGWGSIQRGLKRLRRRGLTNVRLLQVDAAFAMDRFFPSESLNHVYINFPDPWPKERHHPRRLFRPVFVEMLAQRMVSGGDLLLATDHPDLAEWVGEVIRGQDRFDPLDERLWVDSIPGRSPTKYERKAIEAGSTIHYFQLTRRAFDATPVSIDRIGDVPNVNLAGDFDRHTLLAGLETRVWKFREQNAMVKLRGVYGDLSEGHRLVEVIVKEGSFRQTFGVSVLHRPEGGLLVKLASMGHPRPTWGVKQAVLRVARVVLETCPGMSLESSTVSEVEPTEEES